MDESFNLSELSFTDFEEPIRGAGTGQLSTPVKKRRKHFKKPTRPKGPPKAVCAQCNKSYYILGFYQQHVRKHAIEKASSRYPDRDAIMKNLDQIDKDVLEDVIMSPSFGKQGEMYKRLANDICVSTSLAGWIRFRNYICDMFLDSVVCQKFLLPSSLLDTLVKTTENFLSSIKQRNDVIDFIEDFCSEAMSRDILQLFVCDYTLKFMHHLLRFISTSVRNVTPAAKKVTLDEDDKQVIYYIGGSVMRVFLRIGKRFPRNKIWGRIVHAIQTKILEGEEVAPASSLDKEWTETRSRGALLHIGAKCQHFFTMVAEVCHHCENYDGSLHYEQVLKSVHQYGASTLWDEMLDGILGEEESLQLLCGVVRHFCQTYGKGIAKRRVNAIGGKATASLPLRHSVAPRQKK